MYAWCVLPFPNEQLRLLERIGPYEVWYAGLARGDADDDGVMQLLGYN